MVVEIGEYFHKSANFFHDDPEKYNILYYCINNVFQIKIYIVQ